MNPTKFQKKVLKAWIEIGKEATSREIADKINSQSEWHVSKAMDLLEKIVFKKEEK